MNEKEKDEIVLDRDSEQLIEDAFNEWLESVYNDDSEGGE